MINYRQNIYLPVLLTTTNKRRQFTVFITPKTHFLPITTAEARKSLKKKERFRV